MSYKEVMGCCHALIFFKVFFTTIQLQRIDFSGLMKDSNVKINLIFQKKFHVTLNTTVECDI